jgi:hypothetical protein
MNSGWQSPSTIHLCVFYVMFLLGVLVTERSRDCGFEVN